MIFMTDQTQTMSRHYILEGRRPQPASLEGWAHWFETADRIVARTVMSAEIVVSTVFIGIDHNYTRAGPPILFETLVMGGSHDGEMDRYATWEEAERGHEEMIRHISLYFGPCKQKEGNHAEISS